MGQRRIDRNDATTKRVPTRESEREREHSSDDGRFVYARRPGRVLIREDEIPNGRPHPVAVTTRKPVFWLWTVSTAFPTPKESVALDRNDNVHHSGASASEWLIAQRHRLPYVSK